jgi:prenyltransferase/squalene oxidase-like repeat protein
MSDRQLQPYAKAILTDQRADGGWAQRAELPSDAYATGQPLFALATAAGADPHAAAYRKGVQYLLATQRRDGSWYVRSRASRAACRKRVAHSSSRLAVGSAPQMSDQRKKKFARSSLARGALRLPRVNHDMVDVLRVEVDQRDERPPLIRADRP